jgi:PKD repeat protein
MKTCICLIFICVILFALIPCATALTTPSVEVTIYRVQRVDPIEIELFEDGADWNYKITLTDSESSQEIVFNDPTYHDEDDRIFYNVHDFQSVKSLSVTIQIDLYEADFLGSETADISSSGQRTSYIGDYNLKTNSLTGDTVEEDGQFHKTSGDFDGSTGVDENDAHLWFSISDTYELPVADTGKDYNKSYTGTKVNFDGSGSESFGSSITKYQWDFDADGVFDAEGVQTSYTYEEKGEYVVTLLVTDNFDETDTDTCIINIINRLPTASFSYSPSTATFEDQVNFYDTSTDDGSLVSWFWEFGDEQTSEERNPIHKYEDKGTYNVKLTVTDNDGASNTTINAVEIVNIPPTSNFTYFPSNPVVGENIQFTDKSIDPENKLTTWAWDFGDGYTASTENASHKYEEGGAYTITLVVADDEGATGTTSKDITVQENFRPTASFNCSVTEPHADENMQFMDTSEDPDGSVVSWHWEFGDGETSTEQNPTHKYTEAGTFTLQLMVTDDKGATATISQSIVVEEALPPSNLIETISEQQWILIILVVGIVAIIGIVLGLKRRSKQRE